MDCPYNFYGERDVSKMEITTQHSAMEGKIQMNATFFSLDALK